MALTAVKNETLGTRIVAARRKAAMGRQQLSDLSGVPYSSLAEIEQGKRKRSGAVARLAAILQVNALWLETGRGAMGSDKATPMPLDAVSELSRDEVRLLSIFRTVNTPTRKIILRQVADLAKLGNMRSTQGGSAPK